MFCDDSHRRFRGRWLWRNTANMDVSVLDEKGRPAGKPHPHSTDRDRRMGRGRHPPARGDKRGAQLLLGVSAGRRSEVSDLIRCRGAISSQRCAQATLGLRALLVWSRANAPCDKRCRDARLSEGLRPSLLVATTCDEVASHVQTPRFIIVHWNRARKLCVWHKAYTSCAGVGRGQAASTCLLMYQAPLSETGRQRARGSA